MLAVNKKKTHNFYMKKKLNEIVFHFRKWILSVRTNLQNTWWALNIILHVLNIKYNLSIILFQIPSFFLDCSYHCNISVVFVLIGKKTDLFDLLSRCASRSCCCLSRLVKL